MQISTIHGKISVANDQKWRLMVSYWIKHKHFHMWWYRLVLRVTLPCFYSITDKHSLFKPLIRPVFFVSSQLGSLSNMISCLSNTMKNHTDPRSAAHVWTENFKRTPRRSVSRSTARPWRRRLSVDTPVCFILLEDITLWRLEKKSRCHHAYRIRHDASRQWSKCRVERKNNDPSAGCYGYSMRSWTSEYVHVINKIRLVRLRSWRGESGFGSQVWN